MTFYNIHDIFKLEADVWFHGISGNAPVTGDPHRGETGACVRLCGGFESLPCTRGAFPERQGISTGVED